jgi:hypothetical protein
MAAAARRWLSAANVSTSVREKPSMVAMRSAEMPWGTVGNRSLNAGLSAVDGDRANGEVPPGHRLDAAGDDQVLMSAAHTHRRHRDRLLGRSRRTG